MMAVAIVDLHWTPDQFWAATPHEFWAAWELIELRARAARKAAERP